MTFSKWEGGGWLVWDSACLVLVPGDSIIIEYYVMAWYGLNMYKCVLEYSTSVDSIIWRFTGIHRPGVEGAADVRYGTAGPDAALVRGVLRMEAGSQSGGDRAELLDAAGRGVMELQSGANDVRALSPEVYFVRSTTDSRQSEMRKVIVAR